MMTIVIRPASNGWKMEMENQRQKKGIQEYANGLSTNPTTPVRPCIISNMRRSRALKTSSFFFLSDGGFASETCLNSSKSQLGGLIECKCKCIFRSCIITSMFAHPSSLPSRPRIANTAWSLSSKCTNA